MGLTLMMDLPDLVVCMESACAVVRRNKYRPASFTLTECPTSSHTTQVPSSRLQPLHPRPGFSRRIDHDRHFLIATIESVDFCCLGGAGSLCSLPRTQSPGRQK